MDISLITLTTAAPLASALKKRRQASHLPAYRRAYVERMKARQTEHGPIKGRGRMLLLDQIALRSQSEVAAILGVSRQAVVQVEHRAISKLRRALLGLYGELTH